MLITALFMAAVAVSPPRPAPNVGSWVTTDDLPGGLLAPDDVVVSEIRLTISTTGRITACVAPVPSAQTSLDDLACRLVTARGRYRPAVDADGNRVESKDTRRIRWQVPRDR